MLVIAAVIMPLAVVGQEVPYGINYQAVARDLTGSELANRSIDIRFSIVSGTPYGVVEYQEIHSDVVTSRYGVFTATIGQGTPVGGEHENFADVRWETGNHHLRVEIKFASQFEEMGSLQFLSVPYALYAARSLEPGPAGPEGPPGDPATDNQRLSFDGVNLTIDDGETNPATISTVNLGVLVNNPDDEIQYLSIKGDSLSITKGNSIKLQDINIDDADADPTNEIQDLRLTNNILTVTNNPDATQVDLSHLINDNDVSATNEIQNLTFDPESNSLAISGGNSVSLGQLVAFKADVNTTISLDNNTPHTLVFPAIRYNDGGRYNFSNGIFTANAKGNYTFYITLSLPFQNCTVSISVDGIEEQLIGPTVSAGVYKANTTMRLMGTEQVSIIVRQTNGFPITTFYMNGTFSGFRVF